MQKIPKHLNIITNPEDTLAEDHPNLVIKEGDEYIGYTITHNNQMEDTKKIEITKGDIESGFPLDDSRPSWLTNNKNILQDKKYQHRGRAKQSLFRLFFRMFIFIKSY